jgi:hypothetical protein
LAEKEVLKFYYLRRKHLLLETKGLGIHCPNRKEEAFTPPN